MRLNDHVCASVAVEVVAQVLMLRLKLAPRGFVFSNEDCHGTLYLSEKAP